MDAFVSLRVPGVLVLKVNHEGTKSTKGHKGKSRFPLLSALIAAMTTLCALAATVDARAQPSSDMERCATRIRDVRGMQESGVGRVVSAQRGQGRLILAGVEHSNDPHHAQFAALATLFWETQPTMVFYEGDGSAALRRTPPETIRTSGEPGLLRYLAEQAGVPALSFEPERSEVHRELLRSFSPEQVQMFQLLRSVRHLSADRSTPWEHLAALIEGRIASDFGVASEFDWPIRSFADLEVAFARAWPDRSMRDMPRNWFNPTLSSAATQSLFLNDVNAVESNFRNRSFYGNLAMALFAGRRVFAAVGASHVPILAPALECLDAPPSFATTPT